MTKKRLGEGLGEQGQQWEENIPAVFIPAEQSTYQKDEGENQEDSVWSIKIVAAGRFKTEEGTVEQWQIEKAGVEHYSAFYLSGEVAWCGEDERHAEQAEQQWKQCREPFNGPGVLSVVQFYCGVDSEYGAEDETELLVIACENQGDAERNPAQAEGCGAQPQGEKPRCQRPVIVNHGCPPAGGPHVNNGIKTDQGKNHPGVIADLLCGKEGQQEQWGYRHDEGVEHEKKGVVSGQRGEQGLNEQTR